MPVETVSSNITHLSLRGASLAIGDLETFTIGQASVNRESLLRTGHNLQAKALLEAIALGSLMIDKNKSWRPQIGTKIKVAQIEPEQTPKFIDGWNTVLGTSPAHKSPTKDTNGLAGVHSWKFRTYAYRSDLIIGRHGPDLIGVGMYGRLESSSPDVEDQLEDYIMPIEGTKSNYEDGRIYQEVEEPKALFHVAQIGLLRAARLELGDKSADRVIE